MNAAYPLLPISILTLLAFFVTWIFARWEILHIKWHRKFWNYLLLITFLVSGLLGLVSVIKVNYKLDIPFYGTLLKWHVSFGIAMVIIALIHLSWHLNYYLSFGNKSKYQTDVNQNYTTGNGKQLKILLFLLGMTTIINQVVIIREFISILTGNELIIGIIMALWLLITAWGALHASNGNFSGFTIKRGMFMLFAVAVFSIFMISLLYLLKTLMYPPGTLIDIGNSVTGTFIILFPMCFLSGYLFTVFATLLSNSNNSNETGKSYAIESLGSLLGGILFSIMLGRFFNSIQVMGLTASIILLAGSFILKNNQRFIDWKLLLSGLMIPLLIFIFNPELQLKKTIYPNQTIQKDQSTRYGNITVTEQSGQFNVFENNHLLFYTQNVMMNEETVHFAMVQHPNPKRVLLISGGLAGMIDEIKMYPVEQITYLESNPELFRIFKEQTDSLINTEKVEIVKKDIRRYLSTNDKIFDVILINLPPPNSLGLNRFYTKEFYETLQTHCNAQTIICTSLSSTANYAGGHALDANSSLWKILGNLFKKRILVMGEKNYFIASDSPLSMAITKKIAAKNIPTEYVNQYYLDDELLSMRSKNFVTQLNESAPVNSDFHPYIFIQHINHWLSYFGLKYRLIVVVPVLLFVGLFYRTNQITIGLYTGGFTAASLEVILLLAYQVYFGNIYLATALFFAVFMAGLAFGSSGKISSKLPIIQNYYLLQFILAAFALALPFIIQIKGLENGWILTGQLVFFILIFLLATAIGYEFLLASKLNKKSYTEISGINYSMDLLGSAFGAFLTAIVLLPLTGVFYSCIFIAALNLISGGFAFSTRKSVINN